MHVSILFAFHLEDFQHVLTVNNAFYVKVWSEINQISSPL